MKVFQKIVSVFLCCIIIAAAFSVRGNSVSAASTLYTINYWDYPVPTSVLKHQSPTMQGDQVKWFQCAINYLCQYGDKLTGQKLSTAYMLEVDGSFGKASKNATIAFQQQYGLTADGAFGSGSRSKMIEVLKINNGGGSSQPPAGGITTADIKDTLREIMNCGSADPTNVSDYDTNRFYWTAPAPGYQLTTCKKTAPVSRIPEGSYSSGKRYSSYHYVYVDTNHTGASQCFGFADYVLARTVYKKTGVAKELVSGCDSASWSCPGYTKISGSQITKLNIGDIVRTGTGHSVIVMDYNPSNGEYSFAECWGGQKSLVKIGGGIESRKNNRTLADIKKNKTISYVIRYTGGF